MASAIQGDFFRYVEIGIGFGGALESVQEFFRQIRVRLEMHAVDLPGYAGEALRLKNIHWHFVGASEFLRTFKDPVDFCFIDGCHGKPCVTADFLGIEPLIRPGGIVCFHDTSPECQDRHFQPHCQTGIDARAAVRELGLLDDRRPGWLKFNETSGDQSKGGHGCLFVKKYVC